MNFIKLIIEKLLWRYVKKFFKLHPNAKLIVVVGSVGKTSTKTAIETILSQKFTVRASHGNFNTTLSAPLEILGVRQNPNPKSITSWLRTLRQASAASKRQTNEQFIIQELGIDTPGEMARFCRYVRPFIAIVTAISPEHMENFKTLDTVAKEELLISQVSQTTIFNSQDIDEKYWPLIKSDKISYGQESADVDLKINHFKAPKGFSCNLRWGGDVSEPVDVGVIGTHNLRTVAGASAAALIAGMTLSETASSLVKITPVPGRMNLLPGINSSTLIDDSYNSSPIAAKSALETLYQLDSDHKIAILGSMNELGDSSKAEHQSLGKFCRADQLELVVTVGSQANKYLATAAKSSSCKVKTFADAKQAGQFLKANLAPNSLVLIKGSQGGIYLEEATKLLLADPKDSQKLVRQSADWLKRKRLFFGKNNAL